MTRVNKGLGQSLLVLTKLNST